MSSGTPDVLIELTITAELEVITAAEKLTALKALAESQIGLTDRFGYSSARELARDFLSIIETGRLP